MELRHLQVIGKVVKISIYHSHFELILIFFSKLCLNVEPALEMEILLKLVFLSLLCW